MKKHLNDGAEKQKKEVVKISLLSQDSKLVKNHELDDELYIKDAFEKDPQFGLELLYKRYFQSLCSHSVKFTGSREAAEDLVSEVFATFYGKQIYLEVQHSFRFYLFKSVRNRSYNYLKWDLKKKIDLSEAGQTPNLFEDSPDQISQYDELYQDYQEAINKLPIERRKVYLLRKFEGMKYQEIANELNISIKTVDVQLTRANQFIREILKDKWVSILILAQLLYL